MRDMALEKDRAMKEFETMRRVSDNLEMSREDMHKNLHILENEK